MCRKLIFLVPVLLVSFLLTAAQDSLGIYTTYKYKIGGKFISEKSSDFSVNSNEVQVFSGGLQIVRRIKQSSFSFESGLYYLSRANNYYSEFLFAGKKSVSLNSYFFRNLFLPFNLRYDTKVIYISAGPSLEYLVGKKIENSNYLSTNFNNSGSKKIFPGFNMQIGLEKQVTSDIFLFIEGRLSYLFGTSSFDLFEHETLTSFANYGFAVGINFQTQSKSH